MSDAVHLLIPFAACSGGACAAAMGTLELPHLRKLLARLAPTAVDEGETTTLSPPHERVLARECAIDAGDGLIPWAAWQEVQSGRDPAGAACAWFTPCHWRVGSDHIAMTHPRELQLADGESSELLAAMRPYFEEDGLRVEVESPGRWLARGEVFANLPSASLDRVIGRSVDDWLPRTPAAGPIRRLQQEMQMLLYTHPLNDARAARGLPPVNSFWVSGTGALPSGRAPAAPSGLAVADELRDAALLDDALAWSAAWQQLDAQRCTSLLRALDDGRSVTLTLAGERNARTWSSTGAGFWQRLSARFSPPALHSVLQSL